MRTGYSTETRERAENFYCCCGHTHKTVAGLTGVSLKTLKHWSVIFGWVEKRRRIDRAHIEIRTNTVLVRQRLLAQCLESLDPKDAIAVLTLESLIQKAGREDGREEWPMHTPETRCTIKNDQDAAAALEEACRARINLISIDPGQLNFAVIRGLREAMTLADELKRKGKPEKRGGLSDETARQIRMKILGLSE